MFPLIFALATAVPDVAPPRPYRIAQAAEDDFGIVVTKLKMVHHGVSLGLVVANRVAATNLFVHLEPDESDPRSVLFIPADRRARAKSKDPRTFYLQTDGGPAYNATLFFPLEAPLISGVLVVGECDEPYRHGAIALHPNPNPEPTPISDPVEMPHPLPGPTPIADPVPDDHSPGATQVAPVDSGATAPGERVIGRYKPLLSAFGSAIILKDGTPGPEGQGWARIYTDLPDVTLDEVERAIRHPQQVWAGNGRLLFIAKLSATRAIALEVRNQVIRSAQMVTKESFPKLVGPGTSYPSRIYIGR